MNNIILITARGGSKSIKNKNMIVINKKPLIYWTIDIALKMKNISNVIVSTDSEKIASYSKNVGALVPFMRPKKFSGDRSNDLSVFKHFLNWYKKNSKSQLHSIIHLRPTNPLRNLKTLNKALDLFINNYKNFDSLRSVSLAEQSAFKMWFKSNNSLTPVIKQNKKIEYHSSPRQILKKIYWQNGYIDIIKPSTILNNSMTGSRVYAYVINEKIYELDYLSDLKKIKENIDLFKDINKLKYKSTRVPN